MSKALIEKIRKAREQNVTAGGHTFTVRRPTDGELAYLPDNQTYTLLCRFVVGWDFHELDIIPGGGPEPVPFDAAVWAEWIGDRSDLWLELGAPLLTSYKAHEESLRAAAKN